MFKHITKYKTLALVKDQSSLFWTLFFPIVLTTVFYLAMSGLLSSDTYQFDPVTVAVVTEGAKQEDLEAFDSFLGYVGVPGTPGKDDGPLQADTDPQDAYIIYSKVEPEEAKVLLDKNQVYAYVEVGEVLSMTAKNALNSSTSLNGNILRALLERYAQIKNTMGSIEKLATTGAIQPGPELGEKIRKAFESDTGLQEEDCGTKKGDVLIYFFALLGYLTIFPMSSTIHSVAEVEANQSPRAARSWLAPYPKWKRFFAEILPIVVMYSLLIVIIYYYLGALGVDLGPRTGYILVLLLLGILTGIFMGTAVGSLFKGTTGIKSALSIGLPLAMGFFSGMMASVVRKLIKDSAPFMQKINPVSLVTEGLYSLYSYTSLDRYFEIIIRLGVFLVICIVLTIIGLRRSNYESI
jgi:ABC-2 type transport system permease protein